MPLWLWLVDVIAVALVLFLFALIGWTFRRRWIARGGSTFEVSVSRRGTKRAMDWKLSIGRYRADSLEIFRAFSFSLRPVYRMHRGSVTVADRRDVDPHGFIVIDIESGTPIKHLAMAPGTLTSFLAWLESSPPGHNVNNVV